MSDLFAKEKKSVALKQAESAYKLSKIIQINWDVIFGKLADQVQFSHVYNGILVVYVRNPLWVTELSFYKKELLVKINKLTKKLKVYDVRIKLDTDKPKIEKPLTESVKYAETLEEKIILENRRKKTLGYWQCPTCHMWYDSEKPCVFC